jgi:hypothetical protein
VEEGLLEGRLDREVADPVDLVWEHLEQKQEDHLDMLDIVAGRGIHHQAAHQELEGHLGRQH